MTFNRTLILLLAPSALACCVPTAPDGCAGWRKITGTGASVEWLAVNDPPMLEGVIAHAEFGRAKGCWQ